MAPARRAGVASDSGTAEAGHGSAREALADDLDAERRECMARNAAALAALGVVSAATELRKTVAASKAAARPATAKAPGVRKPRARDRQPVRRSGRIAGMVAPKMVELDEDGKPMFDDTDEEDKSRAVLDLMGEDALALAAANVDPERRPVIDEVQRLSNSRGVHNKELGISCHFCRQKTLCCEANCPRCSQNDSSKDCLGKSSCSKCQSGTGIFCRACLLTRYGLVLEQVQSDPNWLCPHCYEEEHGDWREHGWFCNSSFCMKKRGSMPTGIAIHKAREMGYASVAHMLQATVLEMAKKQTQGRSNQDLKVQKNDVQATKATRGADVKPAEDGDEADKDVPLRQLRSKRTRTGKAADEATAGSGKAAAGPARKQGASPPVAAAAAEVEL